MGVCRAMKKEKSVREKLELLKRQLYEELNELKERIAYESNAGGCGSDLRRYKPSKHQKSNKKNYNYRKYKHRKDYKACV